MHHTLLPLHMSVRYSVPNVLTAFPVMHVYSRRCTRIALGVVQGWELHVPQYHVIYGCVASDMYVICMSYASLNCMSYYSFAANPPTYTHSARRSKLMYLVSIGSTIASGTRSLLTGAQLQPLCSRLSVLSLTSLPDCYGCCGLLWPPLGDPCYLTQVNCKDYFSCAPLHLLQFLIIEEGQD